MIVNEFINEVYFDSEQEESDYNEIVKNSAELKKYGIDVKFEGRANCGYCYFDGYEFTTMYDAYAASQMAIEIVRKAVEISKAESARQFLKTVKPILRYVKGGY